MPLVQTGRLVNNLTGNGPDGQSAEYTGTFTANGATPVTISEPAYAAGDIVLFGLVTPAGTVGNTPTVKTVTTGTGFTVGATASDTSVYRYWGFTATAAQTA